MLAARKIRLKAAEAASIYSKISHSYFMAFSERPSTFLHKQLLEFLFLPCTRCCAQRAQAVLTNEVRLYGGCLTRAPQLYDCSTRPDRSADLNGGFKK